METQRTLENFESRVSQHKVKAEMLRMSTSQRVESQFRKIQDQVR